MNHALKREYGGYLGMFSCRLFFLYQHFSYFTLEDVFVPMNGFDFNDFPFHYSWFNLVYTASPIICWFPQCIDCLTAQNIPGQICHVCHVSAVSLWCDSIRSGLRALCSTVSTQEKREVFGGGGGGRIVLSRPSCFLPHMSYSVCRSVKLVSAAGCFCSTQLASERPIKSTHNAVVQLWLSVLQRLVFWN